MKITVALTTYNRPQYLGLAISAILDQTFKDFELLILDNGSTIETTLLIKSFVDPRIKHIRNEINDLEFINCAFKIAQGDYLIITHDDDVMEKTILQREVDVLDNNPNINLVATNISQINVNGDLIKKKTFNFRNDKLWNQYEYIQTYFLKGNILPCPTIMMRFNIIKENEFKYMWRVGPMVDLYLIFQINLLVGSIYLIKEPLYKYRIHNKQASEENRLDMEIQVMTYVKELISTQGLKKMGLQYEKSSLAQIIYLLILSLISGSVTYNFFKMNIKQICKTNQVINRYVLFWGFKGIIRGLKKKIQNVVN